MTAYALVRRFLLVIPMLFGIVTLTFIVTHVLPGDPTYTIAGQFATPDVIANIRHTYGFDKPLLTQYWDYLTGVVTNFDLGKSIFTDNTVKYDLGQRLPSTLELVSGGVGLALLIGIPLGALAARSRGKKGDAALRWWTFVLLATPEFWLALMCLYIFFFRLGWAPAPTGQLGVEDPVPHRITGAMVWDSILTANWGSLKPALAHAAIPWITMMFVFSAPIIRLTRSSMLDVLEADYIRFGRSCGLKPFTLWRYSVRAALPPVITFTAILFTLLIGAAVLIENIFAWGGAAQYATEAIQKSDYSPVQGFVLIAGAISVGVFLIVDLLYVVIDPRVKL